MWHVHPREAIYLEVLFRQVVVQVINAQASSEAKVSVCLFHTLLFGGLQNSRLVSIRGIAVTSESVIAAM